MPVSSSERQGYRRFVKARSCPRSVVVKGSLRCRRNGHRFQKYAQLQLRVYDQTPDGLRVRGAQAKLAYRGISIRLLCTKSAERVGGGERGGYGIPRLGARRGGRKGGAQCHGRATVHAPKELAVTLDLSGRGQNTPNASSASPSGGMRWRREVLPYNVQDWG
uniref:Uncharacterized protein n=1 Tax=Mycena chlorophos TaxID=658473 RepID=A0ABQ0LX54_MYCCL|nr:predicted protein [Mycena chlorophos]